MLGAEIFQLSLKNKLKFKNFQFQAVKLDITGNNGTKNEAVHPKFGRWVGDPVLYVST